MNSEEKRAKGIYFGGLGLLLFGIGFLIYAIGQIILGSIQTAQMGASHWMKVEDDIEEGIPVTEIFQDEPSIGEVIETLTGMQNKVEKK
ncbi:MAG: hypothetical protein WD708_10875 [Kiritimatiellia bacterium]